MMRQRQPGRRAEMQPASGEAAVQETRPLGLLAWQTVLALLCLLVSRSVRDSCSCTEHTTHNVANGWWNTDTHTHTHTRTKKGPVSAVHAEPCM